MAAFYREAVAEFLVDDPARILGRLAAGNQHNEVQKKQIRAWEREIEVLATSFRELIASEPSASGWQLLLEYPIPRRHKRLDAVLIAYDVLFCLEFKTEDRAHTLQAQRQVEDYAMDLRDFHQVSRNRTLVPVVIVPRAVSANSCYESRTDDAVRGVRLSNAHGLAETLLDAFRGEHSNDSPAIDPVAWDNSPYRPVPTIIEAATCLYAGHNVAEIAHSHAGATNLTVTSDRLVEIIQHAQRNSEKVVCFVTGVPGAGKTLAGLNIVHHPALRRESTAPVFLSGNGPLVKIVSAAIAQDHKRRARVEGASRTIGASVQNVHTFVREGQDKPDKAPADHVVIFDEAQRAWNQDQNYKKNGVEASEPQTMLSTMDRHRDWAVVVALVGGGQEIHSGEAGLSEWGKALSDSFPNWKIAASPRVLHHHDDASFRLFSNGGSHGLEIREEPSLHLEVNLRSFRAREYAKWVDAVLAGDRVRAATVLSQLRGFPIVLTRSLTTARQWLRHSARGQQRAGLVASSSALRLRADGIELSSGFRQGNRDLFVHWFLSHLPDVRSSSQLEIAATEFECQGLELDWVGICWGGDFAYSPTTGNWSLRKFSGTRWSNLNNKVDQQYRLNTYRVLLTRARRGSVIWVPEGDDRDPTRASDPFDATADYLASCGLTII